MTEQLILEQIGEFRAGFPDLKLPSDVDVAGLGANPFFVTLPIGKVGALSRNLTANGKPRRYTREGVEAIVSEVNKKRPEGGWGHLKQSERQTTYDPPALRWLTAELVDDMAWGKALVLSPDAVDYYRTAKATNARVGTSIYGTATLRGDDVVAFELERIDLADPSRVGVIDVVARPHITSEMEGSATMTDEFRTELVAELRQQVQTKEQRIAELTQTNTDLTTRLTALEGIEDARQLVAEMRELVPGDDLVSGVRALVQEMAALRQANNEQVRQAVVAEMVQIEEMRPLVLEMLGTVDGDEDARNKVTEILGREYIQEMAKAFVVKKAGPHVVLTPQGKVERFEYSPEAAARARANLGI